VIPLGLSAAAHADLHTTLRATHSINITVQIMDLNGAILGDVSGRLLSGQVNIDRSADITRSCTLSLLDPRRSLNFDSDSPDDGALYVDRMVRVIYSVKVGTDWVDIPVFTGPISKVDRTDDVVNVEAQGKEALAMGQAWRTRTFKRGALRVNVVRDILEDLAGETRFSFPDHSARLAKDFSIGRENVPWNMARAMAASMAMQLFYDGRGVARLRRLPASSSYNFSHGDNGSVVTAPQITYSLEDLKNIILVKGAGKISEAVAAPYTHPLSPQRLGRKKADGTLVPRYYLEVIEDTAIRTRSEARQVGRDRLNDALLAAVDVAFDSLPIPHIEPGDLMRLVTDEFATTFRLNSASIPLVVGEPMSVGYLRRVSVNKRRIRAR
jgi:hypothetical protein